MRFLLLFIALTCVNGLCSQGFESNYYPLRTGKVQKPLLKSVLKNSETLAQQRQIESSEVKKDFIKTVTDFNKSLAKLDTQRVLMDRDTLSRFLNKVSTSIIEANPLLQGKKITIFTLRDEEVNASNCGPGIIFINLGLLARANTYEEMVFTLCHEISHEYLEHFFNAIIERSTVINSSEFKKKVRRIKRADYNNVKLAELLIARTMAKLMVQERKQELQADSLGLIFYNNLKLDKSHAINDMSNLDSAEIPYYHLPIDFKKTYANGDAFFNDEWLGAEKLKYMWNLDSSLWIIPDSLKTHPDCKLRVERLQQMSRHFSDHPTIDQTTFIYMRNLARFEILEEFLSNEDYANALYFATQLLADYPENSYLHNVIVNSFIEMGNALKDHRFSEVVDQPHELYYPGFNNLLSFLHHLNSSELKKFAVNYFNAHLQSVTNDAFTAFNAILIKAWETPKEQQKQLIDVYKTNFKDKFYAKKLETKFKPKK